MAYEWPPLTPGDTDEVAQRVAAVLEEAWQRLEARQQTVSATMGGNTRATHILATLQEFKQAITAFRSRVDAEARAFVQRQLPWLYQQGAEAAATVIGSPFTWTQIHKDALQMAREQGRARGESPCARIGCEREQGDGQRALSPGVENGPVLLIPMGSYRA